MTLWVLRLVALAILLCFTGCGLDQAGKEAGSDAAKEIKAAAAELKEGMKDIDPVAIKQLLAKIEHQQVEVEALRKENQALIDQLQGKIPIEAVGTYQVRDPSLSNATAKITHIGGAQFQFERSDRWKQTFVWDKAQQVFIGPNAQDRAYYFRSKGVLAFETQSFWYR